MRASRSQRPISFAILVVVAAILVANMPLVTALGTSYEMTWQTMSTGGTLYAQNPCYRLSGTMGQAVVEPGISGADTYTLFVGFWPAAPIVEQDQLFFNAFEACIP